MRRNQEMGIKDALPLYEAFESNVKKEIPDTRIKVQKTQISFYNRHLFTCYIVITFGLNRRLDSPRIDAATEPYPNRWTHHVLVSDVNEIDDELMQWGGEAAVFSNRK